jgi:tRNA G18 (ribose-2'-O)-methylase SpoU
MGWRPGIPVPLQFQTTSYKKWISEQSKKNQQKISTTEFEKQLTDILMNHSITEKLVEEKTNEETEKLEKWVDDNDGKIEKMGQDILDKYTKMEEEAPTLTDDEDN